MKLVAVAAGPALALEPSSRIRTDGACVGTDVGLFLSLLARRLGGGS